jgi:hypothetical protein
MLQDRRVIEFNYLWYIKTHIMKVTLSFFVERQDVGRLILSSMSVY